MIKLKPQAIFYRVSVAELYIVTNDRKNLPNSVKIEKKRLCNTSSGGTDALFAYNFFSPYINAEWDTIYASPYIPSADLSVTTWDVQEPTRTFVNDIFFAIYSLLHVDRGLKPKYIFSGYNYYMSAIELSDFLLSFVDRLKHKPTNKKKIFKNKPEAYLLSKYWPIESYKFIAKETSVFRWLNRDLRNEVEWASIKRQKILKALITTIAWAEVKDLIEKYQADNQGKNTFGFTSQGRYWYLQNLLVDMVEEFKTNPSDDLEVAIVDIQQILFERLILAQNRKRLSAEILNWHKQYMPPEPIYLPRLEMFSPKIADMTH